ncbi:sensor histidine kinase [Azospirillum halopraeferens]|uniref:sensor histidine kinase n=1 Tax=Azospirillum halopraeferens TaxID=34010 RepID=UPI0004007721|nr:ATP-binding protein [Azospirillum halopraeferens]
MLAGVASWFDSSAYMPHGVCLLWRPDLLALHVGADALTGLAYYSIPVALVYFVWRRRDVAFSWVFWLFAAFILACGTTHFFGIWTLWNPDYALEGVVKAVTAAVSVLTAAALWLLMPRALALPSPRQLAITNAALQREIAERRAAEERYTGFFNNLAEGLFVVTVRPDGRFALDTLNPVHARATGLDPARICGRLVEDVLPPATATAVVERYTACVAAGGPIDYEEVLDLPVGRRVWHTVLVPVRDVSGRVVQLLGSARDITERKRLQEELEQASKLATLGTLAAGMAHEMSQPLNIIRIWAENALSRLREGTLDAARTEKVLTLAAEQTERMGRIIDHMRTFARRDRGGAEPFDPAPCVRSAVDLVRNQYALEGIAVSTGPDGGEPGGPVLVLGRPLQLEQVVLNLLSNAYDAIREQGRGGRIAVEVDADAAADHVRITVSDTGGGIPESNLPRIFDPFFTTKEVGKGTGLGLSIGFGIVDAMGGRIEAQNLEHGDGQRGVRFTITLPVVRPAGSKAEVAHG